VRQFGKRLRCQPAVYGGADPIGRWMKVPGPSPRENGRAMIVGVVGGLRYAKLDAPPKPETYIPYRQSRLLSMADVMVRSGGNPTAIAAPVRTKVADLDRTQPVFDVQTLDRALADSIAPRRFNLLLLGVFAAVALVLAVVGIYGVMGYTVTQRTHEIGVRMVVGQGMGVAALGIVAGVAAAFGLTRLMASLLYETAPTDGVTFGVVCGVLAMAAFVACCDPALRAARVDPAVALRYE
jgi:putative ABC transport system permease protein